MAMSDTTVIAAEPEHYVQDRWRCPHCRRSWAGKKRAEEHIPKCWYNRGCKSCRHADLLGGSYVDGCELGEDLIDPECPDGRRVIPRGMCPLWEGASES